MVKCPGESRDIRGTRFRKHMFAVLMGTFLFLPVMPTEFTSFVTAFVWIFSGAYYAMAFVAVGTFFRIDSVAVFSGIQGVLESTLPPSLTSLDQVITIGVMFTGNLASAYLFRSLLRRKVLSRLPRELRASL
jgi:hypothetical protein